MPTLFERSLIKFGENSLVVVLPKSWVRYHKLKPKDKVLIVADSDLIISIKRKSGEREIIQ